MEDEGEMAAALREDGKVLCDDWNGSDETSAPDEVASKVQLLQSLSTYLSCAARTMCFSTDFDVLSVLAGSEGFLGHKEVAQLRELVVRELNDQKSFLSALSWIFYGQVDEGAYGNVSRVFDLEIVPQKLRCCIKILPLVDCFDKNASLASTKLLDGILQQLCHPTKLFQLLGSKAKETMHSSRSQQTAHGNENGTFLGNTESHEAWMLNVLDMDSQHRKEFMYAILEVYVDELLLHPEMIARLLRSRGDTCRSLVHEQMTCRVKHTEASLEAAFVHVLLSLYSQAEASPGSMRKGFLVGKLSLPAGLILLEKFSNEEVPHFYVAHIVRFLANFFHVTAPVGFGQVDDLDKTRQTYLKKFCAGGVDWSYCSQELPPNFDFEDDYFHTGSSSSETILNLASLTLEQAILLYSRISLAADTCADVTRRIRCHTPEKSLLGFYLSKFSSFLEVWDESFEVNTTDEVSGRGDSGLGHVTLYRDDFLCYSTRALDTEDDFPLEDGSGTGRFSGHFMHQGLDAGFRYGERKDFLVCDGEEVTDTSRLVVALLQLISGAVKCISREVRTSTCLKDTSGDHALDPSATPSLESDEADFDKILHCVFSSLSLCFPASADLFSIYNERRCGRAGQDEGDSDSLLSARGSLNTLVGQVIVFFTNILRGEVCRGAPDGILEEHFHLVESLVGLLLTLDEGYDIRKSTEECILVCNCPPFDICRSSVDVSALEKCRSCFPFALDVQQLPKFDSTSNYLEDMVLSLRGMLQGLTERQRPIPEFFLLFILKQLSTRDALSLMAMAFSSSFKDHSDVLHTKTTKTGLFQTEGLVTEVLQLAMSEPTKQSSLFTFIIYMNDLLQDHVPITVVLSTAQIAEPMSWFEGVAYILTLASQLVVCERRMLIRNGKDFFVSFISKVCQAAHCMLGEGIAAAQWLSDHCKSSSQEACYESEGPWEARGISTVLGRCYGGEAWSVTGNTGHLSIFLDQVDMLRNAVEELARSLDSSLLYDLSPLLEKGSIFFAALSELPTEQKLAQSRWSLYLFEQTQQRPLNTEPGCHLGANSLAVGLGRDHTDGRQTEFAERVVEENLESQKTSGSDTTSVGDETLQAENVICSEEPSTRIGSHLAGKEVILAQSNSTAEVKLSSKIVTIEKRQTRSVTSLIKQKLHVQEDGLDSEQPEPTRQERKRCSLSTSAIIKRLLRNPSASRGKSTSSSRDCNKRYLDFLDDVTDEDVPPSNTSNFFVDHSDSFDDLKDFIVTKKGRDYSVWLNKRQKVRRRLYSKNFFKRLQEKKELLLLLDM